MDTNYKIKDRDIATIFETFPVEIAKLYTVTKSKLTDDESRIKINDRSIQDSIGVIMPTSAGKYHIGGNNIENAIMINGEALDVALKGCRPIGIPVARLTPGTHYLNRIGGVTWLSSKSNSATGTKLEYNPKYLHAEVQGGGGGGAGTGTACASAGGGGGGYCYTPLTLSEGDCLKLIVGAKGNGGSGREAGSAGGASMILRADGTQICVANGGAGGGYNDDPGGQGGIAIGGDKNISGGKGGKKANSGEGVYTRNVQLNKPELTTWSRGGTQGGPSSGNYYGGGGGASAFSNGRAGNTKDTPSPATGYGAGGAGGGYNFKTKNGGHGADGLINLYY